MTGYLAFAAIVAASALQAAPTSGFTAAQADAGAVAAQENHCVECHTPALTGRKGDADEFPRVSSLPEALQKTLQNSKVVPPLAGADFMAKWGPRPAKDLVQELRKRFTSLGEETQLDLAAYFLKFNGAKPGTQPLTVATDVEIRSVAGPAEGMSFAQQNLLTQKYCAVCHEDAHRNGGLSLQHFDAAHADPGVAAMLVSKLKTGAVAASGAKPPDKATVEAWTAALSTASAGANRWTVARSGSQVSAGIVEDAGISKVSTGQAVPDSYRLSVTCHIDSHQGEVQLAWSPDNPKQGQPMSASVDGQDAVMYKIEGHESMGNTGAGDSGPGAIVLQVAGLPQRTLTIRGAINDETVAFPFGELNAADRQALSACF